MKYNKQKREKKKRSRTEKTFFYVSGPYFNVRFFFFLVLLFLGLAARSDSRNKNGLFSLALNVRVLISLVEVLGELKSLGRKAELLAGDEAEDFAEKLRNLGAVLFKELVQVEALDRGALEEKAGDREVEGLAKAQDTIFIASAVLGQSVDEGRSNLSATVSVEGDLDTSTLGDFEDAFSELVRSVVSGNNDFIITSSTLELVGLLLAADNGNALLSLHGQVLGEDAAERATSSSEGDVVSLLHVVFLKSLGEANNGEGVDDELATFFE